MARLARRAVLHTFARHRYHSGRIAIAFISNAQMKKQHKIWLDDDSPTDVLTFNLADPPRSRIIDAQILICPAIARARARLARTSWVSETLLYIIHGCLHLCGYNDAARKDFARIHDMEDRILLDLGRGPVFNPDPSTRPPARRRPRKSGTSKTPR